MIKLMLVTIFALLLPVLWVVGAKAEPRMINHARSWSATSDASSLNQTQKQGLRLRDEITGRVSQMNNLYRMMSSSSAHIETARGLLVAAETLQSYANQTTDNLTLESYAHQINGLQQAMTILKGL